MLRTYWRHARALLTLSILPTAAAMVALWAFFLLLSTDAPVINGYPIPAGLPSTPVLVLGAVTLVAALLVTLVALGALVIVGGAALLGEQRVSPASALRRAIRRLPALLAWMVLTTVLLMAAFVVGGLMVGIDWPVYAAVPLTMLLFAYFAWVYVALPVAMLEDTNLPRALLAAWRMGRDRRPTQFFPVLAALGLGYLVANGAQWVLPWVPLLPFEFGDPAALAATTVLYGLFWPLSMLLLCSPVLFSPAAQTLRPRAFDTERVLERLPQSPGEGGRRPVPVLGLAATLLLTAMLGPGLLLLNPTEAPVATSEPVEGVLGGGSTSASIAPHDHGTELAVWERGRQYVLDCAPNCFVEVEVDDGSVSTDVHDHAWVDGTAFFTAWITQPLLDLERGLHLEKGLTLWRCEEEECDLFEPETVLDTEESPPLNSQSAIQQTGDGLIIVSAFAPDDGGETRQSELRAYHCADTDCTDVQTVDLVSLPVDIPVSGGPALDLAVGPDEAFAVSAYDGISGQLNVITCADTDCADPQVAQIADEPAVDRNYARSHTNAGAAVEIKPDGSPVVAYRSEFDGAVHTADCRDETCTEVNDHRVTEHGWTRPAPGLALDSQGRPQIATFDLEQERLLLVSCDDPGCAETTDVPLQPLSADPSWAEIALDEPTVPASCGDRKSSIWAFRRMR